MERHLGILPAPLASRFPTRRRIRGETLELLAFLVALQHTQTCEPIFFFGPFRTQSQPGCEPRPIFPPPGFDHPLGENCPASSWRPFSASPRSWASPLQSKSADDPTRVSAGSSAPTLLYKSFRPRTGAPAVSSHRRPTRLSEEVLPFFSRASALLRFPLTSRALLRPPQGKAPSFSFAFSLFADSLFT